MFTNNKDEGRKEFYRMLNDKKKQYGIIDIEDNYSKECVLNIIKEDVNISDLTDLKDLPSKSVRDQEIYRMNKELHLTPKMIEKLTCLSADCVRKIINKYEKCLSAEPVPNTPNRLIGDCPQ